MPDSSIRQEYARPCSRPFSFCMFPSGRTQGFVNTLTSDFPLTLFRFRVTPSLMPSVARVINDTVMHRLWRCGSVSPDRWTEDDKMALLQTSLSLLLLGQAI